MNDASIALFPHVMKQHFNQLLRDLANDFYIEEVAFGNKNPRVSIRLNNLAQLLQDTNRMKEAEPLMRQALAIDEAAFGDEHPRVAIGLNNLAQLLKDTNRIKEAEPLMRQALAIDEAAFGEEHPRVANCLNNLATLLQDTNRMQEAEPLMRQALKTLQGFQENTGYLHPNFLAAYDNFRGLLAELNHSESEIDAALAPFAEGPKKPN